MYLQLLHTLPNYIPFIKVVMLDKHASCKGGEW